METTTISRTARHQQTALPIRSLLKNSTNELHNQLDSHPALKRLLSPSATPAEVSYALSGFYMAYHQLRQQGVLTAWAHLPNVGYEQLPYTLWLTADLTRLGGRTPKPIACQQRIPMHSEAALLGGLYVLLGSVMGSARIANILASSEYAQVREINFFRRSAESLAHFRALIDQLEKVIVTAAERKECLAAAEAVFMLFIESFQAV
ncbi:biliverdin-producing heme oxygenase [Moraxellaceae bacterium AER2_44_116]|nr:biliverdin-producing heme oxygenase [Moraxellaceae bacterium]TQC96797.1 biliverdin-producing heme oxygenase [Moraxellaceae bacterium AER2_44_116]